MAVLVEDEEDEEDEEAADEEEADEELLLLNRLLAPRKPVAAVVGPEPDPVLCTEGVPSVAVVVEEDDVDEPAAVAVLEEVEAAPGVPPPAVLTTVIWRTVALPPVMVTLRPPRFPRSCGTMSEEYRSAEVTPVRRMVSSTVPLLTAATRTLAGAASLPELLELPPDAGFWADTATTAAMATRGTHQKRRSRVE
jgi:hypothetical protein